MISVVQITNLFQILPVLITPGEIEKDVFECFNAKPFKEGYSEDLSAVDENGCVDVPDGPGLGVEYDWDFITAHEVDRAEYR